MNLILIGPQGSGKGTQAQKIKEAFKLSHIEMGSLIRQAANTHTKKGDIIDHLANKKGVLLPDGVVLDILIDHLDEVGYEDLLFDGYPRTVKQYEALKDILDQKGSGLEKAVYLNISDEEAIIRLSSRRNCIKCHKTYSLELEPERTQCDCGGELEQRKDDVPVAIKKRLEAFHTQTQPILKELENDGLLLKVNGEQEISAIFQEIQTALTD